MKRLLSALLLCLMALTMNAQYVDLDLPSGTKWKTSNEQGFYNYADAVTYYGTNLPKDWQFQELIDYCEWTWTGKGYKVTGPNGRYFVLPADGCFGGSYNLNGKWISDENNVYCKGKQGYYQCYCSDCTPDSWAPYLYFDVNSVLMDLNNSTPLRSIRLVQNP